MSPVARAAPPCARPGSTARGSTRCRSIRPSVAGQAHLGAEHHRQRRQRQQGQVHVPGHDLARRPRRDAGQVGHRGHDPRGHGHRPARQGRRRQDVRRRGRQRRRHQQAAGHLLQRGHQRRRPQHADHRHQRVVRQLRSIPDAAAPADLGVTQTPAAGAPRHLYCRPSAPVRNASPAFKVLVFSNRQGAAPSVTRRSRTRRSRSRTSGASTTQRRRLGPEYPNAGPSDTPFSSAANLAQYKVVIGDSSVGNNVLDTAYRMKDGTVVNEQTAFQRFIRVVAATSRCTRRTTRCTTGLVQGLPRRPVRVASGQPERLRARLRLVLLVEVDNEDPTRPSMAAAGFPKSVAASDALSLRPQAAPVQPRLADAQREHLRGRDGRRRERVEHRGRRSPDGLVLELRRRPRVVAGARPQRRALPDPVVPREHLPGHPDRGSHEVPRLRHPHRGQSLLSKLQASGGSPPRPRRRAPPRSRPRSTVLHARKGQISSSLTDVAALRTLAEDPATRRRRLGAQLVAKAAD